MQSKTRRSKRKNRNPVTGKQSVKRINFTKSPPKTAVSTEIYWPDRIDYIRAIAARGLSDEEMAAYLQISPELLASYKAYYPLLNAAIEEGRTKADAEVVAALHKNAVGFEYDTEEVVKTRHGGEILSVTKFMPPDTNAQKFWLTNRNPHWRATQAHSVGLGGRKDAPPIGVTMESKQQVIHSILNLITPRPDGDGKPVRVIEAKAD